MVKPACLCSINLNRVGCRKPYKSINPKAMRNRRENDYRDNRREAEPRWLHGHHQGENSDRGNYTVDSHFNRSRGEYNEDYLDSNSFNSSDERRNLSGGAQYAGEDFIQSRRRNSGNMYGMSYTKDDGYNSGRHYDARADYRNSDYSDLRRQEEPRDFSRDRDEMFGHDIGRRRRNDNYMGHSSIGDYESYRRHEYGNRNYDNDYSGGFAGRNYTPDSSQYGEDRSYNSQDRGRNNNRNR